MNGSETWQQMITIYPNMKALIASGFSETEEVQKRPKAWGRSICTKSPIPWRPVGLAVSRELKRKRMKDECILKKISPSF